LGANSMVEDDQVDPHRYAAGQDESQCHQPALPAGGADGDVGRLGAADRHPFGAEVGITLGLRGRRTTFGAQLRTLSYSSWTPPACEYRGAAYPARIV
jgi:hypothetical protein